MSNCDEIIKLLPELYKIVRKLFRAQVIMYNGFEIEAIEDSIISIIRKAIEKETDELLNKGLIK